MKNLIVIASLLAPAAFAKGGSKQTHHCVVSGAEVQKTHKECTKAGGKWEKGAPTAPAAAPAAK